MITNAAQGLNASLLAQGLARGIAALDTLQPFTQETSLVLIAGSLCAVCVTAI